jgi:hypothetical protein
VKSGKKGAILIGLVVLAVLAAALWAGRREIAAWYRYQTVRKLLDPAEREAVLREVLGWQRYDPAVRDRETMEELLKDEELDRVVTCPQPGERPIFAVFFKENGELNSQDFELIAADGTILDMNVLKGEFKDVNGDGVIEVVQSWIHEIEGTGRDISMLCVSPVRREQTPLLMVAYNKLKKLSLTDQPGEWGWELRATAAPDAFDIVLGPKDKSTGKVAEPQAVYAWSRERKAYLGPGGGYDQPFLRIDSIGRDDPGRINEELGRFWKSGPDPELLPAGR